MSKLDSNPHNPYESIDDILVEWSEKRKLKLLTEHRDWPVRLFTVNECSIFIKPPENGRTRILITHDRTHASREMVAASKDDLWDTLDKVLEAALCEKP
jgi:hypothetical protein